MIYQYIKRYLKSTFNEATMDHQWAILENIKFFSHIEKRYTTEEFKKELSEVKQAFKDYFEPVGKIIFRYKEESGIKFKIFPYSVNPKNSKHLKNIVSIIQNNRKYIEYPYQGEDNQIAILGKIRREINREIIETDESVNIKELIKYAIKIALDLKEKDIITQLKRKYIIKIYNETDAEVEKELEVSTQEESAKFNGYTAKQIEETYKEIFESSSSDIRYFILNVMKVSMKGSLDFRRIRNKYYEDNVLKIIYFEIVKELHTYVSLEDDYILGIASFILKKHFYKFNEIMAYELIECIYQENQNATNFLLYYDGRTVLDNNRKYKVPSLETEESKHWNNSSVIALCKLWMNIKKKKEKNENKLIELDKKIERLTFSLSDDALDEDSIDLDNYTVSSENIEEPVVVSSPKIITPELEHLKHKRIKLAQDIISQKQSLNSHNKRIKLIVKTITKALMTRKKLCTS